MGDRIAVVNQGRLEQIGTPEQLYRAPATRFVAEFMGPANVFPATVISLAGAQCKVKTPFGEMMAAAPAFAVTPGSRLTAIVRPESVRLDAAAGLNGFPVRFEQGAFLGEFGIWELTAGEGRLTAHELCPPRRDEGAVVQAGIDPAHIILLETP